MRKWQCWLPQYRDHDTSFLAMPLSALDKPLSHKEALSSLRSQAPSVPIQNHLGPTVPQLLCTALILVQLGSPSLHHPTPQLHQQKAANIRDCCFFIFKPSDSQSEALEPVYWLILCPKTSPSCSSTTKHTLQQCLKHETYCVTMRMQNLPNFSLLAKYCQYGRNFGIPLPHSQQTTRSLQRS